MTSRSSAAASARANPKCSCPVAAAHRGDHGGIAGEFGCRLYRRQARHLDPGDRAVEPRLHPFHEHRGHDDLADRTAAHREPVNAHEPGARNPRQPRVEDEFVMLVRGIEPGIAHGDRNEGRIDGIAGGSRGNPARRARPPAPAGANGGGRIPAAAKSRTGRRGRGGACRAPSRPTPPEPPGRRPGCGRSPIGRAGCSWLTTRSRLR